MTVPKNTYVGRRYIPKLFQNPNDNSATWINTVSHESLTIVMWQGASYTSRQDVPIGIDINDSRYWTRSADYNAQISIYEQNVRDYHQYVIDQIGIINDNNDEFQTNLNQANTIFKNSINSKLNSISLDINDFSEYAISVGTPLENWSPALIQALNIIKNNGGTIIFTNDTYQFLDTINIVNDGGNTVYGEIENIRLISNNGSTLIWNGTSPNFIICGNDTWLTNSGYGYLQISLENIKLKNISTTISTALLFKGIRTIKLKEVKIDEFDISISCKQAWRLSTFDNVYIRSTKTNSIGIQLTTGCNNIKYTSCGIMECDTGVLFTGNESGGHIISNNFINCDFESCLIAIHSNTQRNLLSTKFYGCHFENNQKDFMIENLNTIGGFIIEKTYFLSGGDIQIGTVDNNGFYLYGIGFIHNTVIGDGTNPKYAKIGYDCPNMIFESEAYGNTYLYTASEQIPSGKLNGNLKGMSKNMPLYNSLPALSWGRQDTKGVNGEMRYDEDNIYFKTPSEWKTIPFRKRHDYPDKTYLNGYFDLGAQTIQALSCVDVIVTVNGLDKQIGWVLSLNPYSYLEPNITFCAWVSGANTITIRLANHANAVANIAGQRWFFNANKIDN
jgi:hypothetical protein